MEGFLLKKQLSVKVQSYI